MRDGKSGMRVVVMVAMVLAMGLAASAFAQVTGLYFKQVEKDGRIYVFNTPERYKSWAASGEVGTAITLIGRGPNGETVIAENETALDLFLFRNNLPGYERPTPKPPSPDHTLTWKDGKTTLQTKTAQLVLSNRMQVRFTETDPEVGSGKGSFRIQRMRTKLDGWIYSKNLTYELQVDWTEAPALRDARITYDFTKGSKQFMLSAGQYKVPFGRQELTSSGSQQFVDRSIASSEFAKGRDIGLQLHGLLGGGKIDWRVGAFNGAGRNQASNDNDKYQYNARLTWAVIGDPKFSEGDFDSTDSPLFALGAGYESNNKHGATTGNDNNRSIVAADAVFKFKGLFAFAELFNGDNDPETGAGYKSKGLTTQLGYFIVPQKFEVAGRYAVVDPTDAARNDRRIETGVVLGYFVNKHNNKIQLDFRQIKDEKKNVKDKEFRLQYQIIF